MFIFFARIVFQVNASTWVDGFDYINRIFQTPDTARIESSSENDITE